MQRLKAVGLLHVGFIEWHLSEQSPLVVGQWPHAVVEPRDQDVAGRILESYQDLGQRVRRIGRDSTQLAGVHVHRGGLDPELEIHQPAQRVGDCWKAFGDHLGIADDAIVAAKPVGVGRHELLEVRTANLFLAFRDHLEVEGELTGCLQPGVDGLPVQRDLPLVIG